MNQARSSLGAAVVNDKIYAIGGSVQGNNPNSEGIVNTTEEYDPATNKWIFKSSMPTSRYNFAIATYQGKIFCFGGITNWDSGRTTITNITEVFDPATDTWTTKKPMPIATCGQANVLGNKIYVIGDGSNGTITQVYEPANDSWSNKASMPKTPSHQVSVTIGNKLYVIGYWQDLDNHVDSTTLIYDPKTDSWSDGKSISSIFFRNRGIYWRSNWWSEGAGATSGVMAPMRIYVFFMQYVYAGPLPNIVYNPLDNSFSVAANEPTNRHDFAVVNLNDTLFIIGGYTMYYPAPDDSLFYVTPTAITEQYIPVGHGSPDPSYLPPEAFTTPQVRVLSPINQQYIDSSVQLVVSIDKTVNWTNYSLDGQQNVTLYGNITLVDLPNGLHNITVYAEDTFGNIGSSETTSFTVAKSEPEPFPVVPVAVASVAVLVMILSVLLFRRHRKTTSLQ
jgi:hypothetical protein